MGANRAYKDSVFTKLFSEPSILISLYNSLNDRALPPDTKVELATLTNVLFTHRRNDIAFIMDGRLVVLVEHQSTINENMPLRMLIYLARVYEKIIDNEAIYKRKRIMIPKPEFIVLYNGSADFPDEKTFRLSDAYKEIPDNEALTGLSGSLELVARALNINEGRNTEKIMKCGVLYEYTRFIGKTKKYTNTGTLLTEALRLAVNECISEGILRDFLSAHAAEVVNMLTLEYDADLEKKVILEEGREEGRNEGREEGMKIVFALSKGNKPEEIADTLRIPIESILKWKELLG
jgi:hypothetical protein